MADGDPALEAERLGALGDGHDLRQTAFAAIVQMDVETDAAPACDAEDRAEMTIEVAKRTARQLAEKPPLALRMAKEAVLKAFESPLSEGLASERKSFYFLFSTEDQKEGMHAFLEIRTGVFKGR